MTLSRTITLLLVLAHVPVSSSAEESRNPFKPQSQATGAPNSSPPGAKARPSKADGLKPLAAAAIALGEPGIAPPALPPGPLPPPIPAPRPIEKLPALAAPGPQGAHSGNESNDVSSLKKIRAAMAGRKAQCRPSYIGSTPLALPDASAQKVTLNFKGLAGCVDAVMPEGDWIEVVSAGTDALVVQVTENPGATSRDADIHVVSPSTTFTLRLVQPAVLHLRAPVAPDSATVEEPSSSQKLESEPFLRLKPSKWNDSANPLSSR